MNLFKRKHKIEIAMGVKANEIYAPVTGKQISLENVNDEVFAQKMMGDGTAIIPSSGKIYAPISGIVSLIFPTKHVIGIKADNGAEIIIHMGIDTVELRGQGFTIEVKKGDYVEAGELIAKVDLEAISQCYDPTIILAIQNSADYLIHHYTQTTVEAGTKLLKLEAI